MIIKVTLFILVILLVAIIASSYYINKEGFDNINTNTRYNFYVNRFNDPSGTPRCLTTLPNNAVAIWDCVEQAPQQKWLFNANNNLMTEDPAFANKCVQVKLDNSLSFETCSPTSTKFDYINNKLTIQGSDKCINLAGGKYPNGSIVNVHPCATARQDTVTWFSKQSTIPVTAASTAAPACTTAPVTAPVISTPLQGTVPQNIQIVPETTMSKSAENASGLQQKMSLLKDIQKIVRNELISCRNTGPLLPSGKSSKETDATSQGQEFEDNCYKDAPEESSKNASSSHSTSPDMQNYIKKDQIPCWGCKLDY